MENPCWSSETGFIEGNRIFLNFVDIHCNFYLVSLIGLSLVLRLFCYDLNGKFVGYNGEDN